MSRNPFYMLYGMFGCPAASSSRPVRYRAEPEDLALLASWRRPDAAVAARAERVEMLGRVFVPIEAAAERAADAAVVADPAPLDAGDILLPPVQAEPDAIAGGIPRDEAPAQTAIVSPEPIAEVPGLPEALAEETLAAAGTLHSLVTYSLPVPERDAIEALLDEAAGLVAASGPRQPRLPSMAGGQDRLPISSRLYQVQKLNRAKPVRTARVARVAIVEANREDMPLKPRPSATAKAPKRMPKRNTQTIRRTATAGNATTLAVNAVAMPHVEAFAEAA
jgi:hypothetical protein